MYNQLLDCKSRKKFRKKRRQRGKSAFLRKIRRLHQNQETAEKIALQKSYFYPNTYQALLSKSESVKFSLIHKWKIFFTDKSVNFHWLNQLKKYFSLLNQSIFTEIISEIWLIYSNLFLAIWIRQISLIISRFLLIQIYIVGFINRYWYGGVKCSSYINQCVSSLIIMRKQLKSNCSVV